MKIKTFFQNHRLFLFVLVNSLFVGASYLFAQDTTGTVSGGNSILHWPTWWSIGVILLAVIAHWYKKYKSDRISHNFWEYLADKPNLTFMTLGALVLQVQVLLNSHPQFFSDFSFGSLITFWNLGWGNDSMWNGVSEDN